jgi:hypothetical protein
MLKTIFSRVMWLARGTSMVVGLALMLALVFGITATALAAVPGDPFKLGKKNSINKLSSLVGTVAGPMLRIDNNGTGAALDLQVGSATDPSQNTVAPLTVNSQQKVDNLNADQLDGLDSSDLQVSCPTGTTLFVRVCIETELRQHATFDDASSACAAEARRLPTGAELEAFRQQEGIAVGGGPGSFEWTGEIIRHLDSTEPPETLVMSDDGQYHRGSHHPTVTLPFRCVT